MQPPPAAPPARGILLINLGSPDSPSEADVRRYLNEFLMDARVLDSPWIVRRAVVSLFILPKRPRETAHAYQSIWTPEGSPLIAATRRVRDLLRARLAAPVEMGMRYGNPSIEAGMRALAEGGAKEIYAIPLYPHYAMSSYETAEVAARAAAARLGLASALKIHPPCFEDPLYIEALVQSAAPHLAGGFDHLLFSYHGIPERHVKKSDPTGAHCLASPDCCQRPSAARATCYRAQVFATTAAFVAKAGIPAGKYSVSFQSRLGRDPWLKPYTDFEFVRLAKAGVKKLAIISPAFVADCLETLEELGIRGREQFLAAGGKEYVSIPCMNDHPKWIDALERWCVGAAA